MLGAVVDKVSTYLFEESYQVSQEGGEMRAGLLVEEGEENANQCLGAERVAAATV